MRNLGRIDGDIATIRQQLGNRYDILPMAYIAEHYFGKSRAWLYQRINGHKVRGKVYTLNEEQKRTFNEACQDLAKEIGSFRLAWDFCTACSSYHTPPGAWACPGLFRALQRAWGRALSGCL